MVAYKDGYSVYDRVKPEKNLTNGQVEFYKYYKELSLGNPIYKKYQVSNKCHCVSN